MNETFECINLFIYMLGLIPLAVTIGLLTNFGLGYSKKEFKNVLQYLILMFIISLIIGTFIYFISFYNLTFLSSFIIIYFICLLMW